MTPRLAVVTGTSTGIGAAVATQLLEREWTVVGIARRASSLSHARYHHIALDLGNLPELTRVGEERLAPMLHDSTWKRVALVNNAASPALLGPAEQIDAGGLAQLYAVNVIAPVWYMGCLSRHVAPTIPLRVVNVSSGAAGQAVPGLAAYGSSKAALRMAGMVLAAEWQSTVPHAPTRRDAAILSYEPGVVDTDMQALARSSTPETMPWVDLFLDFATRGMLVSPAAPAAEIVAFLEAENQPAFDERRLQVTAPSNDR